MSEQILFCLQQSLELLLLLDSLLVVPSRGFEPVLDCLGIAVADLEDLELNLLDSIFKDDSFDVLGNHFPEITDNHFVVGQNSFLEDGNQRVFDDDWIIFILIFRRL